MFVYLFVLCLVVSYLFFVRPHQYNCDCKLLKKKTHCAAYYLAALCGLLVFSLLLLLLLFTFLGSSRKFFQKHVETFALDCRVTIFRICFLDSAWLRWTCQSWATTRSYSRPPYLRSSGQLSGYLAQGTQRTPTVNLEERLKYCGLKRPRRYWKRWFLFSQVRIR